MACTCSSGSSRSSHCSPRTSAVRPPCIRSPSKRSACTGISLTLSGSSCSAWSIWARFYEATSREAGSCAFDLARHPRDGSRPRRAWDPDELDRRRRRQESGPQMFQVFNVNCTHLGCPVNWQAEAKLFLCPCHGGVYYEDGTVAGGPPPRPLFERAWEVSGDRLLVRQQGLPTVKRG